MTHLPTIKIVLDKPLHSMLKNHCREQGQLSQLVRRLLREYFSKEGSTKDAITNASSSKETS